jgi:hypothetical protein
MDDPVRAALQQICDAEGHGWQVAHYAIAIGLERMGAGDASETGMWAVAQKGQPDYITDGLLDAAINLRYTVVEE